MYRLVSSSHTALSRAAVSLQPAHAMRLARSFSHKPLYTAKVTVKGARTGQAKGGQASPFSDLKKALFK